ncbi:hypothetical protein [Anaerostipes sp.]|uniref:hypothetical protein n=1 Tax=Anaerostipes sp. TaxID=1872530 RepID=UPI003528ED29
MMEKSNLRRDLGPYIEKAFSDKAEIKEKAKMLLELSQIFFEDLEKFVGPLAGEEIPIVTGALRFYANAAIECQPEEVKRLSYGFTEVLKQHARADHIMVYKNV